MELLLLVVLVAPLALFMAVRRNQNKLRSARSATVDLRVDDVGIERMLADGRRESVSWPEVIEVEILVTDKGPHAASGGVVIIGDGTTRGALVPLDRVAELGVVDHLCRLPGFDLNVFVDASNGPANDRTLVWARSGAADDDIDDGPTDEPA